MRPHDPASRGGGRVKDSVSPGTAAVVWDLDGTLVDSAADIATSLNRLLGENHLAALDEPRIRNMIGEGVAVLIRRGFQEHDVTPDPQRLEQLVERFLVIYTEVATASTRLFPGAREALKSLRDAGLRQAVCTNKPESITRQVLAGLGIAGYFDVVIGGDTLPRNKPDPLPLRTALESLQATPERSLMVGDSAIDVQTAHAAGVGVAFVTFGYGPGPSHPHKADYLIDDFTDLPAVVAGHSTGQAAT
jgi:phosphoglycolate phosphatase